MSAPFFSVITPSFNQATYLGGCLASVASQGDPDFEHLVFDNLSTDGSRGVAERFPHVQFVSEADRGQSHAVNKGLARSRGDVICWLNSDDEYPPGLFALLRRTFANPKVDVVFGDVMQISYDGSAPQRVAARFDDRLDLVRWWSGRVRLHQPAVFFRRRAAAGLLREDLHYAMDYEYWWRLSENHAFNCLPEVLAVQHRQPDSKTIRSWHLVYAERERIFSPHYGLIDGGDRKALLGEKRRELSERLIVQAHAAVLHHEHGIARRAALAALRERPSAGCLFKVLGVLRRMW